jgi:hypothetical protein
MAKTTRGSVGAFKEYAEAFRLYGECMKGAKEFRRQWNVPLEGARLTFARTLATQNPNHRQRAIQGEVYLYVWRRTLAGRNRRIDR